MALRRARRDAPDAHAPKRAPSCLSGATRSASYTTALATQRVVSVRAARRSGEKRWTGYDFSLRSVREAADAGNMTSEATPMASPRRKARYELNALLTGSGALHVSPAEVSFEPDFDARMLGVRAFKLPLTGVREFGRLDGDRRVFITTSDRRYVFRGNGAQAAWVVLRAFQDSQGNADRVVLFDEDPGGGAETGVYAIADRGFGYSSGGGLLGVVRSFWVPFAQLEGVRRGSSAPEARTSTEAVELAGSGAANLIEALPAAWLASGTAPDEAGGGCSCRAVLFDEDGFMVGKLSAQSVGIVFFAADGSEIVVAARGMQARAVVPPRADNVLTIESNGTVRVIKVSDAPTTVAAIDAVVSAPDWGAPDDQTQEVGLSTEELEPLSGRARTVSLLQGGDVLASARDLLLLPTASELRLTLNFGADPPAVPFRGTLVVDSNRGRFMVPVEARSIRAPERAAAASKLPTIGAHPHLVVFRYVGEVAERNRREFYRLETLESGGQLAEIRDWRPHVLERKVRLLNISRRGCLVRVSQPPTEGRLVVYTTEIRGAEVEVEARVVHVVKEKDQWVAGLSYTEKSHRVGARLFDDRERIFLQARREAEG
jgi:hypothetical protein